MITKKHNKIQHHYQQLISQHLLIKLIKVTIMEKETTFKHKQQKSLSINKKLLIQEILFNYTLFLDHKFPLAKDQIMFVKKVKLNQFHYKLDQSLKSQILLNTILQFSSTLVHLDQSLHQLSFFSDLKTQLITPLNSTYTYLLSQMLLLYSFIQQFSGEPYQNSTPKKSKTTYISITIINVSCMVDKPKLLHIYTN